MKRRSKAIVVLFLIFCSITMTVAGCKDLHCYVDYIDTLTCKYNPEKNGTSMTLSSLNVEWTFEELEKETCELNPSGGNNEYTCNIDMEDFSVDTECTVFITAVINGNAALHKTCGPFRIGDKFKPQTPLNLTISSSENYIISWRTPYDSDTYRSNELAYELNYKKDSESWVKQKAVHFYEDEKSLVLLRSLLEPDEMYVARIRARPKNTSIYRGHWGRWSTPVSWRTPAEGMSTENSWQTWVILITVLFPLSVAAILFVFKWPKCLWKNVWVLIPNPAVFFKPLYMVHHGDFKSWLGSSYYQPTPFESMAFPEVFEVYSQGLLKITSRQDVNNLEKQKLLLTRSEPGKDSDGCRKWDCNKAGLDMDHGSLPTGTQPYPNFSIRDGLETVPDENGDDSYPCVNLDSDNSNILNLVLKSAPQTSTSSLFHSNLHLQEGFLRPNVNILDLVPSSPEAWDFLVSPSQDEDENVFYNEDWPNAFSPDSGNSAEFGYPRVCLDLDTIDSGFCDSECGSPVNSDFGNNGTPPKPLSSDLNSGEEEIYERNYVKQWVPSHSALVECTSKNLIE